MGPVCGNAVVEAGEVCDDGVNNSAYNGCAPGCLTRGPFCGDGVAQSPPESCDDGDTIDDNGCSTACVIVIGG